MCIFTIWLVTTQNAIVQIVLTTYAAAMEALIAPVSQNQALVAVIARHSFKLNHLNNYERFFTINNQKRSSS